MSSNADFDACLHANPVEQAAEAFRLTHWRERRFRCQAHLRATCVHAGVFPSGCVTGAQVMGSAVAGNPLRARRDAAEGAAERLQLFQAASSTLGQRTMARERSAPIYIIERYPSCTRLSFMHHFDEGGGHGCQLWVLYITVDFCRVLSNVTTSSGNSCWCPAPTDR